MTNDHESHDDRTDTREQTDVSSCWRAEYAHAGVGTPDGRPSCNLRCECEVRI